MFLLNNQDKNKLNMLLGRSKLNILYGKSLFINYYINFNLLLLAIKQKFYKLIKY